MLPGLQPLIDDGRWERPDTIWSRWAAAVAAPDPFCCGPHWHLAYSAADAPLRPIVWAEAADAFLVFRLLYDRERRVFLGPPESLWRFGASLFGPGAPEAVEALLPAARAAGLSGLVLSGLRPDDPAIAGLRRRLEGRRDLSLAAHRMSVQCGAALEGGFDGFMRRRSHDFRKKMRAAARLAEDAGVTIVAPRLDDAFALSDAFERMMAVEALSWKGRRNVGANEGHSRRFYAQLLGRLARVGAARLLFAQRDGRDVGYIFGGVQGGVYRGQQFSFVEAAAPLGVGNGMQLAQIRRLCAEGVARYDMGPFDHGAMRYKERWTEIRAPIVELTIDLLTSAEIDAGRALAAWASTGDAPTPHQADRATKG